MRAGVHGLRLACMGEKGRSLVMNADVLAAFDAALDVLRSLGAEVTTFDWDVSGTNQTMSVIGMSEGYYYNREVLDDSSVKIDSTAYSRLIAGKKYSAFDYIAASIEREAMTKMWHEGMGDCECIAWLSPTAPTCTLPLDELDPVSATATVFTRPANFLGLCAISVPTGPMEGSIDEARCQPLFKSRAREVAKRWHCASRKRTRVREDLLRSHQYMRCRLRAWVAIM